MRKNTIVIIIMISVLVMMFISSCGNDDEGPRVITGTLMSWDAENGTVNIDGSDYKVAEGMKAFVGQAEQGKLYEFTMDEHHNIIAAKPL